MLSFARHTGAVTTAPRTARAIARAELTRAILDAAGDQLAAVGPAALSVRAVARELGMASSAVYRYFPTRDSLLTALIGEAFDDLGQAVEDADARAGAATCGAAGGRWRTPSTTGRAPTRTATPSPTARPIPGYAAPPETVDAAIRVPRALLAVARDAQERGAGPGAPVRAATPAELAGLGPVRELAGGLDPEPTVRALIAWAALLGHVSLELFGHMTNAVLDYDAHFAQVAEQLADDLGLQP